jgi:DNA modification methylase
MGGEKAQLCHADPPYGMGKEGDGIANDNLYAAKLDKFQMAWWTACRLSLADNASAYIWGNAEDLWRLWYVGGLNSSERLMFRNEIIWDQVTGVSWGKDGMAGLRQYAPMGERCLFFMLGEQGFNNNADNYWDGWEGIRSALAADCEKMGWGAKDIERICGVGMFGHWFTKSQWTFIPEEHYKKLQTAAREHDAFKREHDAFKREHDELKREHDELKREFYATRAYFDNTHDNMTDVWSFSRVTGEDRHGHATPKPVAMIERCIKSSTPDGVIVAEPFCGSGTTIIAAENLGRKCYAMEISPGYVAVILQRYLDATGKRPERIDA